MSEIRTYSGMPAAPLSAPAPQAPPTPGAPVGLPGGPPPQYRNQVLDDLQRLRGAAPNPPLWGPNRPFNQPFMPLPEGPDKERLEGIVTGLINGNPQSVQDLQNMAGDQKVLEYLAKAAGENNPTATAALAQLAMADPEAFSRANPYGLRTVLAALGQANPETLPAAVRDRLFQLSDQEKDPQLGRPQLTGDYLAARQALKAWAQKGHEPTIQAARERAKDPTHFGNAAGVAVLANSPTLEPGDYAALARGATHVPEGFEAFRRLAEELKAGQPDAVAAVQAELKRSVEAKEPNRPAVELLDGHPQFIRPEEARLLGQAASGENGLPEAARALSKAALAKVEGAATSLLEALDSPKARESVLAEGRPALLKLYQENPDPRFLHQAVQAEGIEQGQQWDMLNALSKQEDQSKALAAYAGVARNPKTAWINGLAAVGNINNLLYSKKVPVTQTLETLGGLATDANAPADVREKAVASLTDAVKGSFEHEGDRLLGGQAAEKLRDLYDKLRPEDREKVRELAFESLTSRNHPSHTTTLPLSDILLKDLKGGKLDTRSSARALMALKPFSHDFSSEDKKLLENLEARLGDTTKADAEREKIIKNWGTPSGISDLDRLAISAGTPKWDKIVQEQTRLTTMADLLPTKELKSLGERMREWRPDSPEDRVGREVMLKALEGTPEVRNIGARTEAARALVGSMDRLTPEQRAQLVAVARESGDAELYAKAKQGLPTGGLGDDTVKAADTAFGERFSKFLEKVDKGQIADPKLAEDGKGLLELMKCRQAAEKLLKEGKHAGQIDLKKIDEAISVWMARSEPIQREMGRIQAEVAQTQAGAVNKAADYLLGEDFYTKFSTLNAEEQQKLLDTEFGKLMKVDPARAQAVSRRFAESLAERTLMDNMVADAKKNPDDFAANLNAVEHAHASKTGKQAVNATKISSKAAHVIAEVLEHSRHHAADKAQHMLTKLEQMAASGHPHAKEAAGWLRNSKLGAGGLLAVTSVMSLGKNELKTTEDKVKFAKDALSAASTLPSLAQLPRVGGWFGKLAAKAPWLAPAARVTMAAAKFAGPVAACLEAGLCFGDSWDAFKRGDTVGGIGKGAMGLGAGGFALAECLGMSVVGAPFAVPVAIVSGVLYVGGALTDWIGGDNKEEAILRKNGFLK